MAYSMYEHSLMKTEKHVQYYPEEYDYTDQNYHLLQVQSPRTAKKIKKVQPLTMYENERKCPIYIHQFNKSPISSLLANYSSTNDPNYIQHKLSKPSSKSQNSKLVIDKLEETYWATWKPSKDSKSKNPSKSTYEKQKYEPRPRENVAEKLIKYFEVSDFPSTSASATDETVLSDKTYKKYEMVTQEIQTDDLYPVNFSEYKGRIESTVQLIKDAESTENTQEETSSQTTISASEYQKESEENVIVDEPNQDATDIETETEITEKYKKSEHEEINSKPIQNDDKKILNHTDSFIITKKKQNTVKEYLQQPRCIKLYKKTVSSYLKGGSYPLRPCLKKETTPKGNFRLGPPGSSMFVTGSSFSKKKFK